MEPRRMTAEDRAPVALVTGAAGGIGAACARRLADDGYRLTLVDVDADRLAQVAGALRRRGVLVQALAVDLAVPGAPRTVVDRAIDEWGTLDVVVPFAALFVEPEAPETPELRDLVRAVNLHQPLELAERAFRQAERRGRGCTAVMPLSDAGLQARNDWIYARAKAELHARTNLLAGAWRHHPDMLVVRAVVYPTLTEFADNSDAVLEATLGELPGDISDHSGLQQLMEDGARPNEVADAVVDAVESGRRWVYLEPNGGYRRARAWVQGEVLGPLLDRMPNVARERLKLLPRIAVGEQTVVVEPEDVLDDERRSA